MCWLVFIKEKNQIPTTPQIISWQEVCPENLADSEGKANAL